MQLLELLHASPIFAVSCAALFGLAVGSFLNVVIYRLPKMMERNWHSECQALLDRGVTLVKGEVEACWSDLLRDGAKLLAFSFAFLAAAYHRFRVRQEL